MRTLLEKPVRDSLIVYVNEHDEIQISQQDDNGNDPSTIILHIDDVRCVIKALNGWLRAYKEDAK